MPGPAPRPRTSVTRRRELPAGEFQLGCRAESANLPSRLQRVVGWSSGFQPSYRRFHNALSVGLTPVLIVVSFEAGLGAQTESQRLSRGGDQTER